MAKQSLIEKILFLGRNVNHSKLQKIIPGKTILITGATYGIGEQTAYALANKNTTLILTARTIEKLQAIQVSLEQKGCKVFIFAADLYDLEQTDSLIEYIRQLPCKVDIFINNAGKSIFRPISESLDRFHDFTRTMTINYYSPVKISLFLLPYLVKNRGQIINISALNVLFSSTPYWSAYQSSKTAMNSWIRCISPELRKEGVAFSTVYLPLVRTRMIAPTDMYKNSPAMLPEQAAQIVFKSIIKRNRKWKPWWSVFPRSISVLFPQLWESASIYLYTKKKRKQ